MQTVNFKCGYCGQLMAVGSEFMGQQVRCPHCQGIVVAPTSVSGAGGALGAGAPPPGLQNTAFDFVSGRNAAEEESIFGPPPGSDDLFGGGPAAPRLEVPAPQPPAPEPMEEPIAPPQYSSPYSEPPLPAEEPTAAYTPPPETSPYVTSSPPEAPAPGYPPGFPSDAAPPEQPEQEEAPRPRRAARTSMGFMIMVVSLASYAVLSTVCVIILLISNRSLSNNMPQVPKSPIEKWLDQMPDVEGDTPEVQKQKRAKVIWSPDREYVSTPLPDHLKVGLGKTLQLGDLEITPLKVERKVVKIHTEGFEGSDSLEGESLALTLRLKNTSQDYEFSPIDNYFDRYYNTEAPKGPPPLTALEVGQNHFYGGPAKWFPYNPKRKDTKNRREWIAEPGRRNIVILQDGQGLKPGDVMEAVVCTDGDNKKVLEAVDRFEGDLIYRVHLRRGVMEFGGKKISTTGVVGVVFGKKDITRPKPAEATP